MHRYIRRAQHQLPRLALRADTQIRPYGETLQSSVGAGFIPPSRWSLLSVAWRAANSRPYMNRAVPCGFFLEVMMNQENISALFRNYIEHFAELNNPEHAEFFKWKVIGDVQHHWNLEAENFSEMFAKAFGDSSVLINNRIVQPTQGILMLTNPSGENKVDETEKVREAFRLLLSDDHGDLDARQAHILEFVDTCNALLEKHYPGKWKGMQDFRSALSYLAMIKPFENYLFKSTPAHVFAQYMSYPNDIGSGKTFKLKNYYDMCDQLVALVENSKELLAIDAARESRWKDPSHHVLAYDLIYCMNAYELMDGMIRPPLKPTTSSAQQKAYREELAASIQKEIDALQDQIDELNQKIDELPTVLLEGQTVKTKAFGSVVITRREGRYLCFEAAGTERHFALPDCVANGFLIPGDSAVIDRCKQEQLLHKQIAMLEKQQKMKVFELRSY